MRIVKIKNNDNTIELTHNERKWQLLSIKGTNPPNTQLNKSNVVGGHGSIYNSSRNEDRQIVLVLRINGNVEKNRLDLYKYLSTNEYVTLYYKTENIDVYIEGYIVNNDCDPNSDNTLMQITINCLEPFFNDINKVVIDMSSEVDVFEFKVNESSDDEVGYFNITQTYENEEYVGGIPITMVELNNISTLRNTGQIDLGLLIKIQCLTEVVNPKITNEYTPSEFIGLNYTFNPNDIIYFDTHFGKEEIYMIRNNQKINLINYILPNITWLQLKVGVQRFIHTADSGVMDMLVTYEYTPQYKGV